MKSEPSREDALLGAALAKSPIERASFLDGACFGDLALRRRIEALLAAREQTDLPTQLDSTRASIMLDLTYALDEAVGQTVGRYKLLEKIGEGGCGIVYVAEQAQPVRRRVALKLIKPG